MLTAQQLLSTAPRRQSLRSLRQQYDLYVMDRIEHYKNSLSREELLRIGDDALAGLGEESQQYLLTDVLMPHMSGVQLAELVTNEHEQIRVLFMSGYTDEAIAQHGILDPGIFLLQKPFPPIQLARKVREVLDG